MSWETMEPKEPRPYLRLLVTPICDARCTFCRVGGEGRYEATDRLLTPAEWGELVRIAHDVGFRHIKLTGGEPLVREDIADIVRAIRKAEEFELLNLGTNGIKLQYRAGDLRMAGLGSITISVNTLNRARYIALVGQDNLTDVINGIRICRDVGLPTLFNYTLMRSNIDEFDSILRFAEEMQAKVKMMELHNESDLGMQFWTREYVPLDKVEPKLRIHADRVVSVRPPGGVGIPMNKYVFAGGLEVMSMNPRNGVLYAEFCQDCPLYPCQDGVSAVRVTHDGYPQKCGFPMITDKSVNLLSILREGNTESVASVLLQLFSTLQKATLQKNWSQEWELRRNAYWYSFPRMTH